MPKFKFYALKISLIIILIFILQLFIKGFTELFVLNEQSWAQPWRFLTAIFLHGSLTHLILNLFALALFGTILESQINSRRFLAVFSVSGILANIVSVNFYPSSLGASGAIFGVIGALIIVRPLLPIWAFGLPMPIFLAGIIWAGADILGAVGFLTGNQIDNTGNIAHLSGMLFGFFLGALYKPKKRRMKKNPAIRFNESSLRSWENRYMR